ncbi:cysteine hydrolase family protein [Acidithiobacillus ferridurans]|uniref:cysteine hydrolase family protein n=1 Tax=Acidithiobacillus ferridurans TaxID=1232575 RepID=UPI001C066C82|nr:isochorismatase family cysteine hydrolase [Acidithiobacillus ferridurans]MBU2732665.1 cysteine hydrolase [Acidithiobacillus ferridurans]
MNKHPLDWKNRHRSFYYADAEIPDLQVDWHHTALLVIDIQNVYLEESPPENADKSVDNVWADFRSRLLHQVIPNAKTLLHFFRAKKFPVFFARIACLTEDGRDRSLSQKRPGFNNILLPFMSDEAQIVDDLKPLHSEIVVTKTTDSAITGTNLSLIFRNMEIRQVVVCGIFTDQCVSSTVRSLADESFDVILIEDACAAATEELHERELEIINNIYCQVILLDELMLLID